MEDADDGPMVRGLDAGAAGVLGHLDVVALPAPEQDPVLWTVCFRVRTVWLL